ncbi:single-stranded-DNA-specific exonuclease RecJ [Anaerolinea thermophila]|uniref:Single-stranded-DNA-specific exonuclease RecJ n=1 Tax=Anaerolinea thermophila (strain DSM 14523 / JCM 11388 / NBRC 100420 / UNI-1) TaxID=926569 RepID=E8N4I0_ANATU|nr:single-stranded-DNA-specific exonuclease RecJ [Anaerolinea thermophila]BAJ63344.1 single-stranded-DNA-specific exonuclease [Anaerolinea thermophila UNI-1]
MEPVQEKRWKIAPVVPSYLVEELKDYSPVTRQLLYNRGITSKIEAEHYLQADLPGYSPFLLSGMTEVVDRLLYAVDHREKIAIYGDYDVDGVTATTLMVEVLQAYGADVQWYIPNRFDEGYGLNADAVRELHERGVDVLLTVDCGIRSPGEARLAAQQGMDIIISDHHQPGSELPEAVGVICPKQAGNVYPYEHLSGVGLAFKIAEALLLRRPLVGVSAHNWLDLVALGTVADVVPLTGENRSLVRKGLEILKQSNREGILALARVAGLKLPSIESSHIGFILGPRLNAAGRVESAKAAVELLLARDLFQAGILAQQLDAQNRERQRLTQEVQERAIEIASAGKSDYLIMAFDPAFNPGVVGLAASRLVELYYRPAIVGQSEEDAGQTRASCRSIPEFHITRALDQCAELLERHGGHQAAAGFTVRNENLPVLQERLSSIAEQTLGNLDLIPSLHADMELPLSEIQPEVLWDLRRLQPTGEGNPEAFFVSRGVQVKDARCVGARGEHLKLSLVDGRIVWDAIAFRQGHHIQNMPRFVDVLYTLEQNTYNGNTTLQLRVRDLKPAQ